jgi:hypothetical protein
MVRHRPVLAGFAFVLGLTIVSAAPRFQATETLPGRLSNAEFWAVSQALSEPDGYFRSDNLLSNEIYYPEVMALLVERARPGGVYLGVGPEQNFNYIVRLRPRMVFITDVRRENLHTQLMYKALFEMAANRVEFVERLFSRTRPAGLAADVPVNELMSAFQGAAPAPELVYRSNLGAIRQHLTVTRSLPLLKDDLEGIEWVYSNFYRFGLRITYNSSTNGGGRGGQTTYADLMMAADEAGAPQSYLASETTFQLMKDLEQRNLVVPVVGNFGGPKALKAVGQYVRDHGSVVTAFYLSNVEQYLIQDGIWGAFCANVATMPLDARSTFIRSEQGSRYAGSGGRGLVNSLGSMQDEVRTGCGVPSPAAALP